MLETPVESQRQRRAAPSFLAPRGGRAGCSPALGTLGWNLDQVRKIADDKQFYLRLSDISVVGKVMLTGKPKPLAKRWKPRGGHSWDRTDAGFASKALMSAAPWEASA